MISAPRNTTLQLDSPASIMTPERPSVATILIVVLLMANLGMTTFIAFRSPPSAGGASTQAETTSDVTVSEANKMGEAMVALYNSRNIDAIFNQFDPLAQVQFSKEQLATQVEKLVSVVGRIESHAYSHATAAGSQGGRKYYVLHYKVRMSGGTLPNCTMTITVSRKPEGLSLFGFFINGTTNQ